MTVGEGTESSRRTVMSCFPTGVTVVATLDNEAVPLGLTVNSFTSVSLDPPLVLVCISRSSGSHDVLLATRGFVVSILAEGQAHVAARFAQRPSESRFDDVAWSPAPSGNPVVEGSSAWLDCVVEEVIAAGDHTIVLARAEAVGWSDEPALLFHRGALRSAGG